MPARPLAALLMAAMIASPALADDSDGSDAARPDILGAWTFQTKPYRQGACEMSGTMRLTPTSESGVYGCELTAVEECTMWGRSVVVQTCEARRFGNQISIRSTIEQMLESKFDIEDAVSAYAPDNFALTVQSASRMYGSLVSAVSAPVVFRRSLDGMS